MKTTYLLRQCAWLNTDERRIARYVARQAHKAISTQTDTRPSPLAACAIFALATGHALYQRAQRRLAEVLDQNGDISSVEILGQALLQTQGAFLGAQEHLELLATRATTSLPAAPATDDPATETLPSSPEPTPVPAVVPASAPPSAVETPMPAKKPAAPRPPVRNTVAEGKKCNDAAHDARTALRAQQEKEYAAWRETPDGRLNGRPGLPGELPPQNPDSFEARQACFEAAQQARKDCRAQCLIEFEEACAAHAAAYG